LKNFFLIFIATSFFTLNINAQVVDKSISGLQTGVLGLWWHNELRMDLNWAFRTEVGYEAPYFINQEKYLMFSPVASIGTRWYYNSKKRISNSNNTFHNSGNFAAMAVRYYPKNLAYSLIENNRFDGGGYLVFSWGMRRNISYRWNTELLGGIGVDPISKNAESIGENNWILNFTIRIGYKYGMK